MARWDRPTTLFYLDPPYWGVEDYYGNGLFGPDDFDTLAERLRRLKGSFIMSINHTPEIREIFAFAAAEEVTTTYTVGTSSGRKEAAELILTGP